MLVLPLVALVLAPMSIVFFFVESYRVGPGNAQLLSIMLIDVILCFKEDIWAALPLEGTNPMGCMNNLSRAPAGRVWPHGLHNNIPIL